MGKIKIITPGLLTTVQDRGRPDYMQYGVAVSGAMDDFSFRIANILAGNEENEAALEFTLLGPSLEFLEDTVIVLTGADYKPVINGFTAPMWESIFVTAGSVLSFSGGESGARGYLALGGGIDVPVVMGSRSTYLKAGIGGVEGRALKAGDIISTLLVIPYIEKRLSPVYRPVYSKEMEINVILGPQDNCFTIEGLSTFLKESYEITEQSDRMGCRLKGGIISHKNGSDIISDGIVMGSIQVPGNGQPIILMSDRQTAGGYAKIATVISIDLPKIAQGRRGDRIHFRSVTPGYARKLYIDRERHMEEIKNSFAQGQVRHYKCEVNSLPFNVTIEDIKETIWTIT